MKNLVAKHIADMPYSGIRRFFDLASTMKDVVSLGVGEPDFDTPWIVRDAAINVLEKGKTTYTSNSGLIELREEISKYLKNTIKTEYEPEGEILVTVGASEGIDLGLRAI
ncbi:MAG: aminotransferase class I/II-fold pyridoxal phosphate-dependent enzyme, partial [Firmicutes bacterium]|nr:aminotransferase class I/II-fold pyridoxal phosphate-dependent enzyme [Bacillota bacterium]